jgi:hypothetical protein
LKEREERNRRDKGTEEEIMMERVTQLRDQMNQLGIRKRINLIRKRYLTR